MQTIDLVIHVVMAAHTAPDAPEMFLGSTVTYKGKNKDIFDIVKNKLNCIIQNIDASMIRDEFKLRVYINYAAPSLRFMLTVHDLCDTHL